MLAHDTHEISNPLRSSGDFSHEKDSKLTPQLQKQNQSSNNGPKPQGRQTTGTPYLVDQYLQQMNNHVYQAPKNVAKYEPLASNKVKKKKTSNV